MSEPTSNPAAPAVRIVDLSAESDDDRVVETVRGFASLEHANAFARAYVRDSLERCRVGGEAASDVLGAWRAFGEDAEVVDDEGVPFDGGWQSTSEAATFAASPAGEMERNWRPLDPRGAEGDEDHGAGDDEGDVDDEMIPPTILVDLPPRKPH